MDKYYESLSNLLNQDYNYYRGDPDVENILEALNKLENAQKKIAKEIIDIMYDVFIFNHKDVMLYMTELERKIKERYEVK